MSKISGLLLFIVSTTLLSSSCSLTNQDVGGNLKINVNFANNSHFNTKAIPNKTSTINISIDGDGLKSEILVKIDKSKAIKGLFSQNFYGLPFGNKRVSIQALDSAGKTLATAFDNVDIKSGSNSAIFEFKDILQKITFKLRNYQASSNSTLVETQLEGGNRSYYEFKGDTLTIDDLPNGKLKFTSTVTDNNNLPLSHSYTELNINDNQSEYFSDLKNISFPTKVNLDINQKSIEAGKDFLLTLKNSFEPKLVTNILKENIINFSDNSIPEVKSIIVNGELRTKESFQSSIILKKGSKINISAQANDKDNDDIGYIWGLVTNSDGSNSNMEIIENKKNEINLDYLSEKSGLYYLNFITTDNKSDYTVSTIPIVIFDNNVNLGLVGNQK